eukprot:12934640-Prorocentrum_lima.AAC.1
MDSWTPGHQTQEGYPPQRARPSQPQQPWNQPSKEQERNSSGMLPGEVIKDNYAWKRGKGS